MLNIKTGQNVLDIAIQNLGNTEGLADIVRLNRLSFTASVLSVSVGNVLDEKVVAFFKAKQYVIATNEGENYTASGFLSTFGLVEKSLKVGEGQTVLDLALLEYGTIERVFDVLKRYNIAITDELTLDKIRLQPIERNRVTRFYSEKNLVPATNLGLELLPSGIDYWIIENDFEVQ